MADLLLDWLNYELKLSRPVTSLEKDFRNGYLLGEILYLHNWQRNFDQFQNRWAPDTRIKNFSLLEPSMRSLGVPFDSNVAKAVMAGKPGVLAKILYQLKVKFQRLQRFAEPTSARGETVEGKKPLPNLPQRARKPTYEVVQHNHFEGAVRTAVEPARQLLENKALKRFAVKGAQHAAFEAASRVETREEYMAEVEAVRQERLKHRRDEEEFMRTWNEMNVLQWIKNQEVAQARRAVRRRVQRKLAHDRETHDCVQLEDMTHEVADLDAFDPSHFIDQSAPEDNEALPPRERFQEAMQAVKRRKKETAQLEAIRDSRRRRFMFEDEEAQVSRAVGQSLDELLLRPSHADARLQEALRHVYTHEEMFVANRVYRERQYEEKRAEDLEKLREAHRSILRQAEQEMVRDVAAQLQQYGEAMEAREAARCVRVEELCRDVVDRMVGLALEAVAARTYTGFHEKQRVLPTALWRDLKHVFLQAPLPLLHADTPDPPDETALSALDVLDMDLYLSESYKAWPWNLTTSEPVNDGYSGADGSGEGVSIIDGSGSGTVKSPGSDAARTPHATVLTHSPQTPHASVLLTPVEHNPPARRRSYDWGSGRAHTPHTNVLLACEARQVLGEVVVEASLSAQPLPPLPDPPDVPRCDMCVCVCGKPHVGKTTVARLAAEKYGVQLLSVPSLIMEAVALAQEAPPPTLPPSLEPSTSPTDAQQHHTPTSPTADTSALADSPSTHEAKGPPVLDANGAGGGQGGDTQNGASAASDAVMGEEGRVGQEEAGRGGEAGMREVEARVVELGRRAIDALGSGQTVPDEVCTALVACAIKRLSSEANAKDEAARGWVLDGFPEDAHQAMLLEKELSGYDPSYTPPTRFSRKSALTDTRPQPPPPPDLIPSAIDLVVYLQAPNEQALCNVLARRVDTTTGEEFQLQGINGLRPPPTRTTNDALVIPQDLSAPLSTAGYRMAASDVAMEDLEAFAAHFGTLRVVRTEGHDSEEVFYTQVDPHLHNLYEAKKAAVPETEDAAGAGAMEPEQSVEPSTPQPPSDSDAEPLVSTPPQAGIPTTEQQQQAAGTPPAAEASETAQAPPQAPAVEPPPRKVLSGDMGSVLTGMWGGMEDEYFATLKRSFRSIRLEASSVRAYLRDLRLMFLAFLKRPDSKQTVLTGFQQSFNNLEADMRFEDETKAELHMRNEELRDALWKMVETRRDEAITLLNTTRENGWLELKALTLQANLAALVQAEVGRFHTGVRVLSDFFDITCGSPPHWTEGMLTDVDSAPPQPTPRRVAKGKDKLPPITPATLGCEPVGLTLPPQPPSFLADLPLELSTHEAFIVYGVNGEPPAQPPPPTCKGGGKTGGGSGKASGGATQQAAAAASPAALSSTGKLGGAESKQQLARRSMTQAAMDASAQRPVPSKHVIKAPKLLSGVLDAAVAYAERYTQASLPLHVAPQGFNEEQRAALVARQHAVWHEASALKSRIEKIRRAGERLQAVLVGDATEVYDEVEGWVEQQTKREEATVEALCGLIASAIEDEKPLELDLRFTCEVLTIDQQTRHVPAPAPPPTPRTIPLSHDSFNADQIKLLQTALHMVHAAEAPVLGDSRDAATQSGVEDGVYVSRRAVVDAMMRLAAGDTLLPAEWAKRLSPVSLTNGLIAADPTAVETEMISVTNVLKMISRG